MPNVISPTKRSMTYLENRKVLEWFESVAKARQTDVSVVLREATSAYYVQHSQSVAAQPQHDLARFAEKAAQRLTMARRLANGELTPEDAQEENAPISMPVRVTKLWPSIRRHVRARA